MSYPVISFNFCQMQLFEFLATSAESTWTTSRHYTTLTEQRLLTTTSFQDNLAKLVIKSSNQRATDSSPVVMFQGQRPNLKCKKFAKNISNIKNLFHSFFSYWHINQVWCKLRKNPRKTVGVVMPKKSDDTQTSRQTDMSNLYYKLTLTRCYLYNKPK